MTDQKPDSKPPFCPIKFRVVGPIPTQKIATPGSPPFAMAGFDTPCDNANCALWNPGQKMCGLIYPRSTCVDEGWIEHLEEHADTVIAAMRDCVECMKSANRLAKQAVDRLLNNT